MKQALTLHRQDGDGLDDFSEEQPLPPPVDVRDAKPAPTCECLEPLGHDGSCVVCGRMVREGARTASQVA